ncbi:hypothetical protein Tco_0531707 [Tanacetum coccineum]
MLAPEGIWRNYKNVSQDIHDQLNAEAEAVQIILTGIDNDIYSIVDACPNACEMWKAIERLKQAIQNEVIEMRAERLARTANPPCLVVNNNQFTSSKTILLKTLNIPPQITTNITRGKAIVHLLSYYDPEPGYDYWKMMKVKGQRELTNSGFNNYSLVQEMYNYQQQPSNFINTRKMWYSGCAEVWIPCYNARKYGHVSRDVKNRNEQWMQLTTMKRCYCVSKRKLESS